MRGNEPVDGICTLGNDVVFDQIVALLNSIEVNQGKDTPVCIYPYDDRLERLSKEVAKRPNVTIYDDQASIDRWDNFVKAAWDTCTSAKKLWPNSYHRFGTHRRYGAFDGPFDRFVYMDADTLLLKPLDRVFQQLESDDFVVFDFQHKDLSHVYITDQAVVQRVFPGDRVNREIFCSGFYGAKQNLFTLEEQQRVIDLLKSGEEAVLYPFAPDQTLLNYMVMRLEKPSSNLVFELPKEQVTGCCVTSPNFHESEGQVTDKGVPLIYLHYIGISASVMARLCQGENLDVPYRDVFLYYRFLHEPELRPTFSGKPQPYNPSPTLWQRAKRKLKRIMNK
jgi:hypothetical protein